MNQDEVPQEGNRALAGGRKAMYARTADGRVGVVPSTGWEVEETVTLQAVDALAALAQEALKRAHSGLASPLEYHMLARRMDVVLLAQSAGIWRWRVRRHLQPQRFQSLPNSYLNRYADALGMSVSELQTLPAQR